MRKVKWHKQRWLGILLAMCMVIGMLPRTAKAATNERTQVEAVAWAMQKVAEKAGYGQQCVVLIQEYYRYLGQQLPSIGYAYNMSTQGNVVPPGWNRYSSSESTPQLGDIVVFGAYYNAKNGSWQYDAAGHVGIVVEVNSTTYSFVDYNGNIHENPLVAQVRSGFGLNDFTSLIRPDFVPEGSTMPDAPSHRPVSDGDYFIVSALEGNRFNPGSKCLTLLGLPGTKNSNDTNVVLWDVYGQKDHVFTVTWQGNGFYKIKLRASDNQCLDAYQGDLHQGTNVQSYADHGGIPQQWYISETGGNGYTVQARCSGFYLDVEDSKTNNGTNIWLWEGNGGLAQRWYFIPWGGESSAEPTIADGEYHIVPESADDMTMSLQGNGNSNGTKIVLEPERDSYQSTFQVTSLGNGYYEILNPYSGRSLDAEDAASKLGTEISLYDRDSNHRYNQTWLIRPCGDGTGEFYIISKANGLYIDFDFDNGIAQGKAINLACGYGSNTQKWKFVPYISPQSVNLSEDSLTLCVGESATLRAKITPDNAADQSLTWGYNDSNGIITTDSNRADELIVTAKALGEIEISVWTVNSKKATCQVTVQEHIFGAAWKSDSENHWKECGCGEKAEESPHTFVWKIDREATEEAEGTKHEECSVCGYRNENTAIEKLPSSHEHDYDTVWKSDAEDHWKECDCGEISEQSAHSFIWVIDMEPSQETEGSKHEECSVCSLKRNEGTAIEKLPSQHEHSFDTEWKSDDQNHWKECGCGEKAAESHHSFVWVIDRKATQETEGLKHEECTACGLKRSEGTVIEILPADHEHSYDSAWKADAQSHWKECGCGERSEENGHSFAWVIDREPTQEAAGLQHEECSVCGLKRSEGTVIEKLPSDHEHSFGAAWTADALNHWKECDCGEKAEESPHSFAWVTDRESTQETEGLKHEECTVCGLKRSEDTVIEKLPTPSPDPTPTPVPVPDPAPTPGPDQPIAEAPFIKGDREKMGWDVILDILNQTEEETVVTVDMNGTSLVPGNVLDDMKGRDITVVFDMGNGIAWSVNGQSITARKADAIDFSVTTGTGAIPADIVSSIANGLCCTQISLAHDGAFECTPVLSIHLGTANTGLTASLYYYNQKSGMLEFVSKAAIAKDGTANLAFRHASDYLIVVESRYSGDIIQPPAATAPPQMPPEDTASPAQAPPTPEAVSSTPEPTAFLSPPTGEDTQASWAGMAIGALIIALSVGLVLERRKKQHT